MIGLTHDDLFVCDCVCVSTKKTDVFYFGCLYKMTSIQLWAAYPDFSLIFDVLRVTRLLGCAKCAHFNKKDFVFGSIHIIIHFWPRQFGKKSWSFSWSLEQTKQIQATIGQSNAFVLKLCVCAILFCSFVQRIPINLKFIQWTLPKKVKQSKNRVIVERTFTCTSKKLDHEK